LIKQKVREKKDRSANVQVGIYRKRKAPKKILFNLHFLDKQKNEGHPAFSLKYEAGDSTKRTDMIKILIRKTRLINS